jgi:hypothetical protein
MSVEDYLASIDWVGAVIVGTLLIAAGAIALRFLVASTSEVGSMLPGATDAASRRILDVRSGVPVDSWICDTCRSVNIPTATRCYRGCGAKEEVGRPLAPDPFVAPIDDDIAASR